MKALAACLTVLTLVFSVPAYSNECVKWDNGAAGEAHGLTVVMIEGEDMKNMVANYNSLPPATSFDPDTVAIYVDPMNRSAVLLVMVKENCVINMEVVPTSAMTDLMSGGI